MRSLHPALSGRAIAAVLSGLMALGSVADPADAAQTNLADKPISAQNSAPPNVVMTIGDSTSMLSDFLPNTAIRHWCRDGTSSATEGAMVASCGHQPGGSADNFPAAIWHQPGIPYNAYDDGNVGFVRTSVPPFSGWPDPPSPAQFWPAPVHSSAFNRLYYDPRITYETPIHADGTSWPSMNATNTAHWARVPADPFKNPSFPLTTLPQVDLTATVTVGQWCISDWVPAGSAFQFNQNICRTNGTGSTSAVASAVTTTPRYPSFPASVMATTSSNAAANGDYLYPFPPRSKPGTDATRFFRNADFDNPGNNIYCDTASAFYPGAKGATCPPAGPAGLDPKDSCPKTKPSAVPSACTTHLGGTMSALTMRRDADGNGIVCRHNNGGTGYKAGPFDYPSGKYTSKVACVDAYAPSLVQAPRHYWKTSVEWCRTPIPTAAGGDPWAGYGDGSITGNCQSFHDADHAYPRFFQFGADPTTSNYATPAFERVDLHPARAPFVTSWTGDDGTRRTVSRSYAQEMENYANWFAYYRTRIQAVQTAASLAFGEIDDKYRVGFHTSSNTAKATFRAIKPFDATQKATWYSNLFALNLQLGTQTPTIEALQRVGDWFTNGSSSELRGATDPIDPTLTCQKNWHVLLTDGQTHQSSLPKLMVGNTDRTVPTLPEDLASKGLVPGQPWPSPYRENAAGIANSLSDYATYYWAQDLRPRMRNNVPGSDADPATWQHLNFAALSFGTEGKLPSRNLAIVEDQLKAGTIAWPQVTPLICPTCGTAPQAPQQPDESGIDDLWHAAINGRGRFIDAQSVAELRLGMAQVLADIRSQQGSRAGAAIASPTFAKDNKYIYRTAFQPGWGGSVTKVEIEPTTGKEVKEIWRAADQLTTQLAVVPGVKDAPWQTERRVVTMNDASNLAVPFLWSNLSAVQQDSLAPGEPSRGQSVLQFLRGDRTHEGSSLGQFRQRVGGPLGDIVNAQAIVVGPPVPRIGTGVSGMPARPVFLDAGYADYFAAQSGRATRVYVGANDGMLHAFDDTTGKESWAYVPKGLYRSDTSGLRGLALQDHGMPPFDHHFYVDGPLRAYDVDFGGGAKDSWRTILVGGLGKGGKSFYAIDVTDPTGMADEASVAKKVLWEFTDSDMGYSFGKPLIAKTRAHGWVVILTSGYNNASGVGKVFFVKPETGKLLATLATGTGNAATPSGLAQVSGYVQNFDDPTIEQIYGGDLLGNLWRFDVSSADTRAWKVEQLARFMNGRNPQPVTSAPQIEIDNRNGVDRWAFVGSGQLLDPSDLLDTQVQSMYAIRDGTRTTPSKIAKALMRADLVEVKNAAGLASRPDHGWYQDLAEAAGQRIVVPPEADMGVVAYVTTEPPGTDPCFTGQPARIHAREYALGGSRLPGADPGSLVESYYSATGSAGITFVSLEVPSGAPASASLSRPSLGLMITRQDNTTVVLPVTSPPDQHSHRMSWRMLTK
jgi:type IV pilus assembly protein PilY1